MKLSLALTSLCAIIFKSQKGVNTNDMSAAYEIRLRLFTESNGSLLVLEEGTLPFPLRRTFIVTAGAGQVRGAHAHRVCHQLLLALRGSVLVSVDNGNFTIDFELTDSAQGLLIPPLNWATQKYMSEETILLVACDQLFDEQDYIRNYEEFKRVSEAAQGTHEH